MFSRRHAATLLVAAVAALAAPAGAEAHAQDAGCPGADLVPVAGNLPQVAQATLCLLNNERADAGLSPLTVTPGLTQPSQAYSVRMVTENFFAHVAPDGATLTDRLEADGYIAPDGDWTVGENLAWGQGDISTARQITIAWMNSPDHRENILTPEFDEIGIGIVPGTPGDASWGATYTTDFGAVTRDDVSNAVATTASTASKPKKASKTTAKRCKVSTARAASVKGGKAVKGAKVKRVATCARTTAKSKTRGTKARSAKARAAAAKRR
jgi:uncharacterized protein YkwD